MGTKYGTVLVGGVVQTYNDAPPADDGSQTEANRVKYVTVTSDLSSPLHSAITRMDAKLLDQVDEGPTAKSSAYTTTLADHNTVIECAGTFTLDLLAVSGNAGYKAIAKNAGSGVITLEVDGGGNIDGAASLTLVAGEARECRVNDAGTAYYSTTGNVASGPSGEGTFVDASDGGPYISSTAFDVDLNVTVSTWESIGPTGSGASNIWTGLNTVPLDVDWIEVKADCFVANNVNDFVALAVWVRKTGSSVPAFPNSENRIVNLSITSPTSGATHAINGSNIFKVPVDSSNRFDINWSETASSRGINLWVTGYGYNR